MIIGKYIKKEIYKLLEKKDFEKIVFRVLNNLKTFYKKRELVFEIYNAIKKYSYDSSGFYVELLQIILNYLINKDKKKFLEDLVKIDVSSIVTNKQKKLIILYIYSSIFFEDDLNFVLDTILDVQDNEFLQKNKYYHLTLMFAPSLFFKRKVFEKYFYIMLNKFANHLKELIRMENEELIFTFYQIAAEILYSLAFNQNEMDEINKHLDTIVNQFFTSKYTTKFIQRNNVSQTNKIKNKKIKIAFVLKYVGDGSPTQVLYAFIRNLQEFYKNKLEIYLLDADINLFSLDNIVEKFKNLKINYVNLHNLCKEKDSYAFICNKYSRKLLVEKTYNFIKNKNIDIVIFWDGALYLTFYLAANRVAPIQIYWSHGNANWNVNGIDIRVSHFPQNSKYIYFIFEEPKYREFYLGPNPKEEKKIAKQIRKELERKYGKNIVVLGTIGRLIKLQSEDYIKLICDVMKKYENVIYLACGGGCIHVKDLVLKYGGEEVLGRWIFPGQVNPHIYGWVIDIWPDTFPLSHGKSVNEFMAKKACFLRLVDKDKVSTDLFVNESICYILKKLHKEKIPIKNLKIISHPTTIEEYKKKLELLIENKNLRELYKFYKYNYEYLFLKSTHKKFAKNFYKFLKSLS